MTIEQKTSAIQGFGYTEAEARFLCLVAHSGYFVRRQFLYSAGCDLGKRAQDFIDKITARKHASVLSAKLRGSGSTWRGVKRSWRVGLSRQVALG